MKKVEGKETLEISPEEEKKPEVKVSVSKKPSFLNAKVLAIRGNELVLLSKEGNGFMVPIGEYKNVKVGDII